MSRRARGARGPARSGTRIAAALLALGLVAACSDGPREEPAPASLIAERIVTLSPHLAELVHSAGAGDRLVGVSAYSDFPEEVRTLPQIGDAFLVDLEQLALLDPDLVLAWASGTPGHTIDQLRERGLRVEVLRTRKLADVASALRTIGRLTQNQEVANAAAHGYLEELDRLRQAHSGGEPIRVFYQISARPLYTVNGEHYVSELIELCGGENVFAGLGELAPLVSEEAVLARDPEVMIAGGVPGADTDAETFAEWRRWDEMSARRYGNFFTVDANLLARATTRLVQTGAEICARLDEGRRNRRQG